MADKSFQHPGIRKYLEIWLSLVRNCFLRQSEYKVDFIGRFLIEIVWTLTQIIFYQAAFRFVPQLGSWQEGEIWFFVGSLLLADSLVMLFIHDNLMRFGQVIRLGLFDFYLLYPLSSKFLSLMRFVNLVSVVNLTFGALTLGYAVTHFSLSLGFLAWVKWFFYLGLGVVMIGLLASIICSIAFWTTQSSTLVWFFFELYRLGHRPENLYSAWLRRILLTLFPAAFFISIPVQIALGKLHSPIWLIAPLIVTLTLWKVSSVFWRRGVKVYEGAMS